MTILLIACDVATSNKYSVAAQGIIHVHLNLSTNDAKTYEECRLDAGDSSYKEKKTIETML